MDLSHAVTVLESLRFTPMSPLEIAEIEQFRFANPRPTYRDISQILAMLERFDLVSREGLGDSTTSEWRLRPHAKGMHRVDELKHYIEVRLGGDGGLTELEKSMVSILAELGGRADLPTIRSRLLADSSHEADDIFQAVAELQAQGLAGLSWGQTEAEWPYLRLSRRGWLAALDHQETP